MGEEEGETLMVECFLEYKGGKGGDRGMVDRCDRRGVSWEEGLGRRERREKVIIIKALVPVPGHGEN